MSAPKILNDITEAGVSLWFDDLSRSRIQSGEVKNLQTERNIRGVTTNPSIFSAAISQGEEYHDQMVELAKANASAEEAIHEMTTQDVRDACDLFQDLYASTDGVDGRVSIEVDPRLAHDTENTVKQAIQLRADVDRENVMVKIPATAEGIPAIEAATAEGISVNVTLIFSLQRYAEVIEAYLSGLEKAKEKGLDLSKIHSVASFFVSRVDTEVDARLAADSSLKSKAGLANARLAYQLFEKEFATDRAQALLNAGARVQRPLWASTGVKDPSLPESLYVLGLVAADTVNTVPEKTLEATALETEFAGDTVTQTYAESQQIMSQLAEAGIDIDEVTAKLEREGVDKFVQAWQDLIDLVDSKLKDL